MTKATHDHEANDEAVIQFLDFVAMMIAKRHLLHNSQSDDPQTDPDAESNNQSAKAAKRI